MEGCVTEEVGRINVSIVLQQDFGALYATYLSCSVSHYMK